MAGFVPARSNGTGRDALAQFMRVLGSAQDGVNFETGVMWDGEQGWRGYWRIGESAFLFGAKDACYFASHFEKKAAKPQWHPVRDWALDTAKTLREIAAEIDKKNRTGERPDGWQISDDVRGSA